MAVGDTVQCFMIRPAGRARRYLRRFCWSPADGRPGPHTCPLPRGSGYHDARAVLDEIDGEFAGVLDDAAAAVVPKGDPRWPRLCPCGYEFRGEDPWQLAGDPLWLLPGGDAVTLGDAPPGAMWWADWFDPPHLQVMLPGGDVWDIDGPSRGGGRWTRTGGVPLVTAAPSVLTPRYHGWLERGVLREV